MEEKFVVGKDGSGQLIEQPELWSYVGTARSFVRDDEDDEWQSNDDSHPVDLYVKRGMLSEFGFVTWRPDEAIMHVTPFSEALLRERGESRRYDRESFWGQVYNYLLADESWKRTLPTMEHMSMLGPWELYQQMLDARVSRLLAYGPPGLGKSYSPAKWAKEQSAFYIGITLTDQTPMSELRGHFILRGNEFVWHDGCVARAWRKSHDGPAILVLNEINEAGTDVETFLHNVLDDPEFARLDLPNGETIKPDPNNMMTIATMNGQPQHLREALRDRFPVKIEVNTVHPDAIAALPADLRAIAERMTNPKLGKQRLSIRPFVAFAMLRKSVTPAVAAQAVFGDAGHDIVAALSIAKGV